MKAVLVNTADRIATVPNPATGWGRVNLQTMVSTNALLIEERMAPGDSKTYGFSVPSSASGQPPVRVTLVWLDSPGDGLQQKLELAITGPGAAPVGSATTTSGVPDPNNVLGRDLPAKAGQWKVAIRRNDNVPSTRPLPFALVVSGPVQ
jgi:hypothetical protein